MRTPFAETRANGDVIADDGRGGLQASDVDVVDDPATATAAATEPGNRDGEQAAQ